MFAQLLLLQLLLLLLEDQYALLVAVVVVVAGMLCSFVCVHVCRNNAGVGSRTGARRSYCRCGALYCLLRTVLVSTRFSCTVVSLSNLI